MPRHWGDLPHGITHQQAFVEGITNISHYSIRYMKQSILDVGLSLSIPRAIAFRLGCAILRSRCIIGYHVNKEKGYAKTKYQK